LENIQVRSGRCSILRTSSTTLNWQRVI
jgi:hypothetical protein